jgi:hypothetical protein
MASTECLERVGNLPERLGLARRLDEPMARHEVSQTRKRCEPLEMVLERAAAVHEDHPEVARSAGRRRGLRLRSRRPLQPQFLEVEIPLDATQGVIVKSPLAPQLEQSGSLGLD